MSQYYFIREKDTKKSIMVFCRIDDFAEELQEIYLDLPYNEYNPFTKEMVNEMRENMVRKVMNLKMELEIVSIINPSSEEVYLEQASRMQR